LRSCLKSLTNINLDALANYSLGLWLLLEANVQRVVVQE
jgi:hypothetical protein